MATVGGVTLDLPSGDPNIDEGQTFAMQGDVADAGEGSAGSEPRAIDAYCGTGAYGRALSEAGWSVVAVESDPAAVKAAAQCAPDGFEVILGRVEDRLAQLLPADVLVVNPPRAGLHSDVPAIVNAHPPARLIYVSCDPATLARDLHALADKYDLVGLRCFDLFPQTSHVETVAALSIREEAE